MEEQLDDIKQKLQLRDRVTKVISEDGFFRVALLKNSQAAITAQTRHNLDYISAFFLARTMSAASLYASFLKGEERILVDIEGSGPIKNIYTEAIHVGEVRGYVQFAKNSDEAEVNQLSDVIGTGKLTVTRILQTSPEPLKGIVQLQKSDIATDFSYYFTQSEQIPTAVILDVDIDNETGKISQSGGLIVQALPGHSKEELSKLFVTLSNLEPLSKFFNEGMNPKQILDKILPIKFNVIGSNLVDFYCRCSKELFIDKLVTLGAKEIQSMKNDNHKELICQYCNEKYLLNDHDFEIMLQVANAKNN